MLSNGQAKKGAARDDAMLITCTNDRCNTDARQEEATLPKRVVRIRLDVELSCLVGAAGANFIFNIHPAITARQSIVSEKLRIDQPVATDLYTDAHGNRCTRLRAMPGPLRICYRGTVDIQHHLADPGGLREVPVHELPHEALAFVFPSRYCESDKLLRAALREFGHLPPGYPRVRGIMEWIERQLVYASTSGPSTSAVDTFVEQAGVCRDYAHLMIALCRALNIPARIATGTDFGSDRTGRNPDFHAYVEVYLGNRWIIFDPSRRGIPMGFVRIGTGRDAADVAFATIFGDASPTGHPIVRDAAVSSVRLAEPEHTYLALSTA